MNLSPADKQMLFCMMAVQIGLREGSPLDKTLQYAACITIFSLLDYLGVL